LQSLLDLDPDLAEGVDADKRRIVRAAAVAVTFQADPGELRLEPWFAMVGSGPGLLILSGVLAMNVSVGDRLAAELVGPGDLLSTTGPDEDDLLARTVKWRALVPCRFAVLDEPFARRIRFWPAITANLMRRASQRTCDLNVQRAIAAQPRLEVRLSLLLWHLATRWGKVEAGGIRLPLPLTHRLMGRLIAAERPSVSNALARLARAGLVTGHGDEWHLHGDLEAHLNAMLEPGSGELEPVAGPIV
jgi:CRP-like cAMP-binding protein